MTAPAVELATAMTIAQILGHKSALTDLPTFARMTGQADSTVYQLVREGRFPLEVIRLGRRRYVRTVDAWKFLGLLPDETAVAPGYQPGPAAENDEAAGYQPAAPVEQVQHSTAK